MISLKRIDEKVLTMFYFIQLRFYEQLEMMQELEKVVDKMFLYDPKNLSVKDFELERFFECWIDMVKINIFNKEPETAMKNIELILKKLEKKDKDFVWSEHENSKYFSYLNTVNNLKAEVLVCFGLLNVKIIFFFFFYF